MNVLALVAHGDDEVIGCGGVLAKHAQQGDNVYLIVVADGVSSREKNDKKQRDQSLSRSCDILGIQLLHQFDFKDNQLDRYPLLELVKAVEQQTMGLQFDSVYTHSKKDLNIDHRVVNDIALTVFRPLPDKAVRAIYAFETLSATHWYGPDSVFNPQRFVDVERYWDKKMQALDAYHMELREFPHARSKQAVTVLAQFRGCLAGMEKAEAFEVLRILE
ncbi:MAG: PIG-L family deacetylase [Desulfobacteraceae bacterium]|nr:PIG-L family deacetylase [Desulfobacteraceae bacterium]